MFYTLTGVIFQRKRGYSAFSRRRSFVPIDTTQGHVTSVGKNSFILPRSLREGLWSLKCIKEDTVYFVKSSHIIPRNQWNLSDTKDRRTRSLVSSTEE